MKLSFCCCAILIAVAAASGPWDDVTEGAKRFVNNLTPKSDLEKATDKFVHFMEEIKDGVIGGIFGGGDCTSDEDCNAILGHCSKIKPVPSCEPTPLGYWMILLAALACLVVFVLPITDDR